MRKKLLMFLVVLLLLFGCGPKNGGTVSNGTGGGGGSSSNPTTKVTADKDTNSTVEEEETEDEFYNPTYDNFDDKKVSCGGGLVKDIPKQIPKVVRVLYLIILVAVPVLLVVLGMLDLIKGITSQKEDEIQKGRQIFVKRLIAGSLVFFVMVIVKLLTSLVADNNVKVMECLDCFISDKCESNTKSSQGSGLIKKAVDSIKHAFDEVFDE